MNMFKPVGATSLLSYLAQLPDERRSQIESLMELIQQATGYEPYFATNMIGFGSFPYVNYKKQAGEWPVIALASQKNYFSIYVCAVRDGQYLAEKYKDTLGRVSVGKSCIRFKKLKDVHMPTLRTVLKEATKTPGLA